MMPLESTIYKGRLTAGDNLIKDPPKNSCLCTSVVSRCAQSFKVAIIAVYSTHSVFYSLRGPSVARLINLSGRTELSRANYI